MAPSLPKLALILYLPVLVLSNKVTKKQNIASDGAAIGQTVMAYPIDVVYTWLQQPSEAEFRKLESYCGNIPGGMQRFRNMGTFRLSLRMLEKNMPWVRKIFIVTPDGTAPAWLDRSRPEIEVVDEKTLFSRKTDLPVHNSQQVETHLHTIPGLAERFIYFNDDMFASRPLQPSFFFTNAGKPIFRTKGHVARQPNWRSLLSPGSLMGEHTAYPLTISMVRDMQQKWPSTFQKISAAHCRGDISVGMGPGWLYQWFGVQSGSMEVSHDGHFGWLRDTNVGQATAWYQQQLSSRPDVICINDDFEQYNPTVFEGQMKELHAFMKEISGGHASKFELDGKEDHAMTVMKFLAAKIGEPMRVRLRDDMF